MAPVGELELKRDEDKEEKGAVKTSLPCEALSNAYIFTDVHFLTRYFFQLIYSPCFFLVSQQNLNLFFLNRMPNNRLPFFRNYFSRIRKINLMMQSLIIKIILISIL